MQTTPPRARQATSDGRRTTRKLNRSDEPRPVFRNAICSRHTMTEDLQHQTFTFFRRCHASPSAVFALLSDPVERAKWGAPSDTATLIYDIADFREGGKDEFRCGSKDDPQYSGVVTYLDIVANTRIVSSEVIASKGRRLLISMTTTQLRPMVSDTEICVTVQLTSLAGDMMIQGAEVGHRASLDNLVAACEARP